MFFRAGFFLLCSPLVTAGERGEIADLIFADGFESANFAAWQPDLTTRPNCNCYFGGDCFDGQFCNYGPAGPFTEDICNWRVPKPNGTPGLGCDTDIDNPGPICDGLCSSARFGSLFGHEDPELVIRGIGLWLDAVMTPSMTGGGPVDEKLAGQALALPFQNPHAALLLGRHVADMLTLAGGLVFYEYFCHFEFGDQQPQFFVDLSGNPCVQAAGTLIVDSVVAELREPGSGRAVLQNIPTVCNNWQRMFTPRCRPGDDALSCLARVVKEYGDFLSIPAEF